MRVSPSRRDERGAVLIVVAAFIIVAVVFLAFVVDIGDQRQDRRQLTTGTDASALDVAQDWADVSLSSSIFPSNGAGGYDCTALAQDYLDRNRAVDAGDYECEAFLVNQQLASVSVFARGTTYYAIGPAIGAESGTINSTSSVRITPSPGGGLRPFALCALDGYLTDAYGGPVDTFVEFLELPEASRTYPSTFSLGGDKFLPDECGQNNGNWGFIQFETQDPGVGNLNGDGVAGRILRGGDDEVRAYDGPGDAEQQVCVTDDADYPNLYDDQPPKVSCLFEATGAGAWNNDNTADAFDQLISSNLRFHLPIYSERVDLGGSGTGFPVVAFAEVELDGYDAQGADDNQITITVHEITFGGDCCNIAEANKVLEICDVGTTGGARLASFATACQTGSTAPGGGGSVTPPPPPPVCEITSTLSPASLTRTRVASGSDKDKLTERASYSFTVADPSACANLEVAVADGHPDKDPDPSTFTPAGNTYTVTFDELDQKFKAGTYTIAILDDDTAFAPAVTAELVVT